MYYYNLPVFLFWFSFQLLARKIIISEFVILSLLVMFFFHQFLGFFIMTNITHSVFCAQITLTQKKNKLLLLLDLDFRKIPLCFTKKFKLDFWIPRTWFFYIVSWDKILMMWAIGYLRKGLEVIFERQIWNLGHGRWFLMWWSCDWCILKVESLKIDIDKSHGQRFHN